MNLLAKKIKLHPLTHFPVGRVTARKQRPGRSRLLSLALKDKENRAIGAADSGKVLQKSARPLVNHSMK